MAENIPNNKYQSVLCDRTFPSSHALDRIYRCFRRKSWGAIIKAIDSILYSKSKDGDYRQGWVKISQGAIAERTGYSRTYISTQVLELRAFGMIQIRAIEGECCSYKFTRLARAIFSQLAKLSGEAFDRAKAIFRQVTGTIASYFGRFDRAPRSDRL